MYSLRKDEYGYADGIERDGYTVLHLRPGTERNQQEAVNIVEILNLTEATMYKQEPESYYPEEPKFAEAFDLTKRLSRAKDWAISDLSRLTQRLLDEKHACLEDAVGDLQEEIVLFEKYLTLALNKIYTIIAEKE